MSPRRPWYRRVNKHVRTLHCECGDSYTRADFYERHLQTSGHNSEFVAVSRPAPDPASDLRHFYCSCGFSYTAAHAFHAHCQRTGHVGDWSRSKYQPKGYGSKIAGTDSASAYVELSTASGHTLSYEQLTELSKSRETQLATNLSNPDDSGLIPPLEGEEVGAFNEADIQESFFSEGSLNDNEHDIAKAEIDPNQEATIDSTAESPLMTCASLIHNSIRLTETSDNTNVGNSSVQTLNENDDTASNITLLQSITAAKIIARVPHDHTGLLPRDIDATDPNARIAHLRHGSRQRSCTTDSNLIKGSSSHAAQSSTTTISRKEQAVPKWKLYRTHTMFKRLREPFKAGVRKIGTSSRTLGKYIAKHKGKLAAALLSAAVVAAAVHPLQSRPLLSDSTPSCQLGWRLDLNSSTHVVKDSEYYSNVDSVFCSDHYDDRATKLSQWTGTVPLYFNDGSMLVLEDVLYDANAHTNIVSLPKLNEAGIFTDFDVAGATIYSAFNDGPVGRATVQENVYCLDDLPPPPSATYYPSRPTVKTTNPGSSPQNHSRTGPPAVESRSGVVSFIDSKLWLFLTSTSATTAYPPFESALEATPAVFEAQKEPTAWGAARRTPSQSVSPTSSMALPFDVATSGSSLDLTSSTSPAPVLKRKSSNDLGRSEKPPRKQLRFETGVYQCVGRQLRGLRGVFADVTKPPGTGQLRSGLRSAQYQTTTSTSTIPSLVGYPASATPVKEPFAGTTDSLGKQAATCPSQWNLPNMLSGLCTQVNARSYALKQRAEMEKNEAESRLDREKKIKELKVAHVPRASSARGVGLF